MNRFYAMPKFVAASFILCVSLLARAEETANVLTNAFREGWMQRSGGFIMNKETGSGVIALLNAQEIVKEPDVSAMANAVENAFWLRTTAFKQKIAAGLQEAVLMTREVKANAFIVLAQIDAPSIIVLPEDRCVIVNVKSLVDEKDSDKTKLRVQKEVFRAVGFVLQVRYPVVTGGLMDVAIKSVSELDKVLVSRPDAAFQAEVEIASERFGLQKFQRTTYRKACERGKAPLPTNKYQQAIWDEFHELPSSPIKITPESLRK